jgi:hypothetical protein
MRKQYFSVYQMGKEKVVKAVYLVGRCKNTGWDFFFLMLAPDSVLFLSLFQQYSTIHSSTVIH